MYARLLITDFFIYYTFKFNCLLKYRNNNHITNFVLGNKFSVPIWYTSSKSEIGFSESAFK